MATLAQRIFNYLQENPDGRFSAGEIAKALMAEDGKTIKDAHVLNNLLHVKTKDKRQKNVRYIEGRPRKFYLDEEGEEEGATTKEKVTGKDSTEKRQEVDLYPLLVDYLYLSHHLHSMIIDASTTSNTEGAGTNKWRHPDLVALQDMTIGWDSDVKELAKVSAGKRAKLWSFEVKKDIKRNDVRDAFFQAVLNSSWANFGYLVATKIIGDANSELEMLSEMHGIGVIILNPDNPEESQIIMPAQERSEVNWNAINRLAKNKHFKGFINAVRKFYQTGDVTKGDWNKPTDGWGDD